MAVHASVSQITIMALARSERSRAVGFDIG